MLDYLSFLIFELLPKVILPSSSTNDDDPQCRDDRVRSIRHDYAYVNDYKNADLPTRTTTNVRISIHASVLAYILMLSDPRQIASSPGANKDVIRMVESKRFRLF
jgi:hypothetical protein